MSKDITAWYDLTKDDLRQFTNQRMIEKIQATSPPPVTPTTPLRTPVSSGLSPAESLKAEFVKGTKRSLSDYPELKDDRYWIDFKENVESIAASHGCDNVLDHLYVPNRNESPLFKEQKVFMYSVFKAKLKTLKSN